MSPLVLGAVGPKLWGNCLGLGVVVVALFVFASADVIELKRLVILAALRFTIVGDFGKLEALALVSPAALLILLRRFDSPVGLIVGSLDLFIKFKSELRPPLAKLLNGAIVVVKDDKNGKSDGLVVVVGFGLGVVVVVVGGGVAAALAF